MDDKRRGTIDPRKLAGYGFVAGMVAAPFLALTYGWNWGLVVMGFALGATTYLTFDLRRSVELEVANRLRTLMLVNGALAAVCFVLLAIRIAT